MTGKEIGAQILASLNAPLLNLMDSNGLTAANLIKSLKAELKAKVSKTQKVKGAPNDMPKKYKTITTTGLIEKIKIDGEIEKDYTAGESLIQWDEIDWGTRQKARIDAHKLRGDYPAEVHKHTGPDGGPIEHVIQRELDDRLKDFES